MGIKVYNGAAWESVVADSAVKLQTARTINGVSFDGTKNITVADSTKLPLAGGTMTGQLVISNVGDVSLSNNTGAALIIGSPTGAHIEFDNNEIAAKASATTATTLNLQNAGGNTAIGNTSGTIALIGKVTAASGITANITGNVTGSSGSCTGNAASATKLQTARTINGVSFNGTANITIADSTKLPLAGGTMTGTITSRAITPSANNTYALGTSSYKWSSVYATTFYGALSGNVTGNVSGSSGSCTGNAATATRLQTARTINGVSFNGSANITVYDSTKLPLAGGTMTGNITIPATGGAWINGKSAAPIQQDMGTNTSSYFPIIRQKQSTVTYNIGGLNNQFGIYMYKNTTTENRTDASFKMDSSGNITATGTFTASKVYNAVYNDYAECFNNSNLIYKEVLHRIVEIDDNECVRLANKNSHRVIGVVSDSYGHLLGGLEEDIENGSKIPVGLAGTLYVYTLDEIDITNIGKFVCADNNGYATIANRNNEGTIVGKIIGFNKEYHQYKVLLILK